jgi:hypothetical protein
MSNEQPNAADTSPGPKWTVMIYMAGDNNLTEECIYSLTEMKKVDLGEDVQVFVQYDPQDDFLPVKRYQINRKPKSTLEEDEIDQVQKDTGQFHLESLKMKPYKRFTVDQKERPGEGFSGDPAGLYNFIALCLDKKPRSDRYFLIICGHGGGILRDYLLRDDSPEGYLTLKEMGTVFRDVHRDFVDTNGRPFVFDALGMDTCLMSMAEIAYELRGTVKVAISCPSYAPASGWPYGDVLSVIKGSCQTGSDRPVDPSVTEDCLRTLAKDVVDAYVNFYADYAFGGLSVTLSALDIGLVNHLTDGIKKADGTTEMDGLRALAELFTHKLDVEFNRYYNSQRSDEKKDLPPPSHGSFASAITLAHWEAQSYNGELYVDLVDFLKLLARRYSEIAPQCNKLASFIQQQFVIASCYSGRKFQWTYGLSIYFPWDHVLPYYAEAIEFPKHSKWVDFLEKYTKATRRPPRRPESAKEGAYSTLLKENFEETRMGPDKMGPDKAQMINPIHSMRNPPIAVAPRKQCPRGDALVEKEEPPRGRKRNPIRPKGKKTS